MQILKKIKKLIKGNNPKTLLGFNLTLFMLLVAGFIFMPFTLAWIGISLFVYFLMACCGISITYHRALTHRALLMPKWLERTFATFASLAGTGSPVVWVMTHRQHHRHADKAGDPHPPGSVYKTIIGIYPKVSGYIRDIVEDGYYRFLHKNYFAILLAWGVLLIILGGVQVFYFIFVLPMVFTIFISNLLNWFGHSKSLISYRNYELKDQSQNNWLLSIIGFGEGWHNNHHRYPGSANFGVKLYEFDISFMVIKSLSYLGLVNNIRLPQSKRI